MFQMRFWLVVAGVVAIAAIHYGLATRIGTILTDRYLTRETQVAQEFLSGILAAEGTADQLFNAPAPSAALVAFGSHVRSIPGIVRANIYAPDGFIRHSTEANLVGVHFSDNPELEESFTGKPVAKLEHMGESSKDEHLALNRTDADTLIEAYVPVPDATGRVVTVVEFYRRDTAIGETVAEVTRLVWVSAAASGLIFIAGLLMAGFRRKR
jgi:hypothetical protein